MYYARVCSKYEDFLFRESILVSKLVFFLHGNFRLLLGNSMVVIQTLYTNLTLLCHIMLQDLFTNCDIWLVSLFWVTWLGLYILMDCYAVDACLTYGKELVLYCIVLYCIVLYCIVLYCIVLYCIVLYKRLSHGILHNSFKIISL